MNVLTIEELDMVNGGGLTLVEALTYIGSLAVSGAAWPVTVACIAVIEYQDYKNGI